MNIPTIIEEILHNPTTIQTILLILTTSYLSTLLTQYHSRRQRKQQLKQWVTKALHKRDIKHFECLDESLPLPISVQELDDEGRLYSASKTREMICSGDLEASSNVIRCARRCRKFGRGIAAGKSTINRCSGGSVNAITEEFYDEAYEQASYMTGHTVMPLLYGVPISVKDCFAQKGALQTGGLACRTSEAHRADKDSVIVNVLRSAGALPIVRGNVGQIMMLPECWNFVWGRTCNPWDLKRVPGGSSGGDASLVAMKCVPMAVGSDVAGSIRIPAAFCGIVGFKPSGGRLSIKGSMRPRKDNKVGTAIAIPSVVGPLARTVEDCALFMKATSCPELFRQDPNAVPIEFRQAEYESNKRLKIGYFSTDGWFEPCQAAKRGLMETVNALRQAGHVVEPFTPPTDGFDTYTLLVSINAADGNMKAYVDALEGETMIKSFDTLRKASNLPNWLRPLLQKVFKERRSNLIGNIRSGGLKTHEYWQKCAALSELRDKWADAFINAGIDAVIHPALPLPAFPHGIPGDLIAPFSYTFLANMLLFPAGVVPITTIHENEQHYRMEDIPENQRDLFATLAGKVMKKSKGLPLSVAVMTTFQKDEECLRVMREVEKVASFKIEPTAYKKAG